jgi:hypothetical protein
MQRRHTVRLSSVGDHGFMPGPSRLKLKPAITPLWLIL